MSNTALLFPGQGTQYIGMGKEAIKSYPVAARVFEEANDALGFDLQGMIETGTMQELTHSANAQPAVVAVSYAYYRIFMQEIGITPKTSAGHSLGEISALIAAGGLSFSDGVRFARRRGFIMHEAFTRKTGSAGIARNINEDLLESVCSGITKTTGHISISAYNSPVQFLVSGTSPAVSALSSEIRRLGGEFIPYRMVAMKVDAPFHCSIMNFLEDKLKTLLGKYSYTPLNHEVIANVDASPYKGPESITDNLSKQLTHPVLWRQTLDRIQDSGVQVAVELGPMSVLKGLNEENALSMETLSWDLASDVKELERSLADVN